MRVLYDYQAFTRQFYGGVSRYFVELARLMSKKHDVDVKVSAPLHINHYLTELEPGTVLGRQIAEAPKVAGRLMNIYNRFATTGHLSRFKPDILHETYFTRWPLSLDNNQVRVVTVYDMIHERFADDFPIWDPTAATKKRAVERADHVLCISHNTRTDLLETYNISGDKVSVVHLGFDSPQTTAKSEASLVDSPYLLYVGIRGAYKNFDRLLAAYAGNPLLRDNFKLICFGGGRFSQDEQRRRTILGLGDDQILWFGGSDNVLMQLYQHAAAFVYPSLYEGFGIPPLEAMSHGCPVVCSDGGSIPEVVGDAGEFFDPYEPDAISVAIEKVVNSSARESQLRALGKQRITNFTWQQCADNTYAAYASLL